jgi:zinc transport system ATP-binding protein
MATVLVEKLCVSYGGYRILREVSFALAEGEFLAIVGPNGGGKTTLIRAMLGLVEKDSGAVSFSFGPDRPAGADEALHPRIGYLPQRSSWADPLFPATVREVVASGLARKTLWGRKLSGSEKSAVTRALAMLQLEDIAGEKVGLLSGGQQQRTHLARALVGDPALLILDEPTGALDPSTRACFFKTLATLQRTGKATVIIVTHDTHNLAGYAQKILYLDREVIFFGHIDEYNALEAAHYFGRGHEECPS